MRKLPKSLTTVTTFSKLLALSMLIIFPIIGFLLGKEYQKTISVESNIYSFSDCGSNNPKTKFSIEVPAGWKIKQDQNLNINMQHYELLNDNKKISIACGSGFGGFDCSQQYKKSFVIGTQKIDACLNDQIGLFYNAFIKSPDGKNTFAFKANFSDSNLLAQILSTFKFTN